MNLTKKTVAVFWDLLKQSLLRNNVGEMIIISARVSWIYL